MPGGRFRLGGWGQGVVIKADGACSIALSIRIADSIDTSFRIVGRLRCENEPTGMPPTWSLDYVRLRVIQAETVPEFRRLERNWPWESPRGLHGSGL
jgi:hypothetical protein